MSSLKTTPNNADVHAFLEAVEHPTRKADGFRLYELMNEITGEPAKMWGSSIIGFGKYHYVYESGREGDWMLTGFSPRKQRLSIYIMNGFESHTDALERLGKHKIGKGCLYINKLADVNEDVLRELISESVTALREKYEKA